VLEHIRNGEPFLRVLNEQLGDEVLHGRALVAPEALGEGVIALKQATGQQTEDCGSSTGNSARTHS
jgi:hypothetical protein